MPARRKEPAPAPRRETRKEIYRGRMTQLLTLMRNGWGPGQLEEYAIKEFGVKVEVAARLVNDALEANVESYVILDRRRLAALTLSRFENAYRLAASQRNPTAMTAANSQIAAHWVGRAPEVTVSGGTTADANDPEEDF